MTRAWDGPSWSTPSFREDDLDLTSIEADPEPIGKPLEFCGTLRIDQAWEWEIPPISDYKWKSLTGQSSVKGGFLIVMFDCQRDMIGIYHVTTDTWDWSHFCSWIFQESNCTPKMETMGDISSNYTLVGALSANFSACLGSALNKR